MCPRAGWRSWPRIADVDAAVVQLPSAGAHGRDQRGDWGRPGVDDGWIEGRGSGVTGEGVVVAVIDSGVAEVPELRGRIVVSMDFTVQVRRRFRN